MNGKSHNLFDLDLDPMRLKHRSNYESEVYIYNRNEVLLRIDLLFVSTGNVN